MKPNIITYMAVVTFQEEESQSFCYLPKLFQTPRVGDFICVSKEIEDYRYLVRDQGIYRAGPFKKKLYGPRLFQNILNVENYVLQTLSQFLNSTIMEKTSSCYQQVDRHRTNGSFVVQQTCKMPKITTDQIYGQFDSIWILGEFAETSESHFMFLTCYAEHKTYFEYAASVSNFSLALDIFCNLLVLLCPGGDEEAFYNINASRPFVPSSSMFS